MQSAGLISDTHTRWIEKGKGFKLNLQIKDLPGELIRIKQYFNTTPVKSGQDWCRLIFHDCPRSQCGPCENP